MTGWPRYLAASRREEGRLALALGDTTAAVETLRQYLALRRDAESADSAADAPIRRLVADVAQRTR
jgi:hypothetical protein